MDLIQNHLQKNAEFSVLIQPAQRLCFTTKHQEVRAKCFAAHLYIYLMNFVMFRNVIKWHLECLIFVPPSQSKLKPQQKMEKVSIKSLC